MKPIPFNPEAISKRTNTVPPGYAQKWFVTGLHEGVHTGWHIFDSKKKFIASKTFRELGLIKNFKIQ